MKSTSLHATVSLLGLLLAIAPSLAQPPAAPTAPPAPRERAQGKPGDDMPDDGAKVRQSLVKIFTTVREPNLVQPWTKRQPEEASGSGVVIAGNRILTNNHVINYASRVFIQPDGSADKLSAKVVATSPGIDLAVLELESKDQGFFDAHPPLEISDDLPRVGETVYAYGYPIGGEAVSVTKGVVSRIEHTEYNGFTTGLRIQIDAAINPGNSGGPTVLNDKLVGISFSGMSGADNVGYVIPVEEVRAFLEDVKDGKFDGRPQVFGEMQTAENDDLRARLGLSKAQTGLMVTEPESDTPEYPLKKWDVIASVGDHDIDNTGLVNVRAGLRLSWRYYVPKLARDGKVPLTIVREGKEMKVEVPVRNSPNRLFRPLSGTYPSYFIIGPLTFSGVAADHVQVFGSHFLDRSSPIVSRRNDKPKFEGEQLVAGPARMFSHPIMKGYETPPFPILKNVNGVGVKSLKHLVEIVRDSTDPFLVFEWADSAAEIVVFNREQLIKATTDVLEEAGIRNQMSEDLRPVWEAKGKG